MAHGVVLRLYACVPEEPCSAPGPRCPIDPRSVARDHSPWPHGCRRCADSRAAPSSGHWHRNSAGSPVFFRYLSAWVRWEEGGVAHAEDALGKPLAAPQAARVFAAVRAMPRGSCPMILIGGAPQWLRRSRGGRGRDVEPLRHGTGCGRGRDVRGGGRFRRDSRVMRRSCERCPRHAPARL